jgi:hypothetical protein
MLGTGCRVWKRRRADESIVANVHLTRGSSFVSWLMRACIAGLAVITRA